MSRALAPAQPAATRSANGTTVPSARAAQSGKTPGRSPGRPEPVHADIHPDPPVAPASWVPHRTRHRNQRKGRRGALESNPPGLRRYWHGKSNASTHWLPLPVSGMWPAVFNAGHIRQAPLQELLFRAFGSRTAARPLRNLEARSFSDAGGSDAHSGGGGMKRVVEFPPLVACTSCGTRHRPVKPWHKLCAVCHRWAVIGMTIRRTSRLLAKRA